MTNRRSARLVYNITAAVALALLSAACASSYNRPGSQLSNLPVEEQQERHAEMLLRYCKKMRDSRDLHVAASMCRRAYDIAPTDATPLYTLAEIYGEMGAIESKAEVYRMALRIEPDDEKALYGLAKTSIDLGNYDIAVAQLERAIQLSADDPRYYNAMGIAKDQLNEHETAQALYRTGLAIDPGNVSLRNNLGLSLSLSGDHEESVAMLRNVASDPKAGAVGSRNLAHAATSAAQFHTELAAAQSQPMEIMKPSEPEFDNASMAVPEHMAFMDALEAAAQMAEGGDAQAMDDTMAAKTMEGDTMADDAMVAAMPKPITHLEGGEGVMLEQARADRDKGARSIGSADGTTGNSGSNPEAAARMPAQAFDGQAKAAESAEAVPSPEKIMSNLKKADDGAAAKPMAKPMARPSGVSYTVQIGSYKSEKGAKQGWKIISGTATDLLGQLPHTIVAADLGAEKGTFYRLRAGDLPNRDSAAKLCANLSDKNIGCYVVRLPEAAPAAAKKGMAKKAAQAKETPPAEKAEAQPTEG